MAIFFFSLFFLFYFYYCFRRNGSDFMKHERWYHQFEFTRCSYICTSINNIQLFHVWEDNRPEYFPRGAWNSSMRYIARSQRPRGIERIELFPAPRGKYSSLLTYQTLNNCFITLFQLRHFFCFLIISRNLQTNTFHKSGRIGF